MPNLKNSRPLFLAIFSGFLLSLIFPRWDLELLAWVALVPLLIAIRDQPLHRAALCGFSAGIVFYFCALSWITVTLVNYGGQPPALSWVCLGFLVFYLSGYIALFCYLCNRWSRNNPCYFFILAPFVWTALEYLRSTHSEYGFSWLGLGYSQFQSLPVIQMAEFTGVYGVSTLIVAVNAAVYYLITCVSRDGASSDHPVNQRILVAGSTLAILAVCLEFGISALTAFDKETSASGPTLRIALVQGNIEQKLKWDPDYSRRIIQTYRDLTLKAAESKPDLVVWPEAATPFFFNLEPGDTESLKNLVRSIHIPLLFGSPYQEKSPTGPVLYNRAYFVSADGETTGSYDKIHLVPFGEFVPFRRLLWFVNKLVEMVGDFGRGEKAPVFTIKDRRFSISICYEVTFPDLVRQPVKDGAEFLVNITNDAWYGRSAASYQHMSMVAMRAVENRVPIVRAANTGITGTIDASGKIHHATDLFVEDLVVAEIAPSRRGPSFYARNGDIFSQTCILASIVLALWIRTRRN